MMRLVIFCFVFLGMPQWAAAMETSLGKIAVTPVVSGLDTPWAFGFLPGGAVLITERDGRVIHVDPNGQSKTVTGVPRVWARGQGGLLDVLVPRDFAQTRQLFFSFARPRPGGGTTAVFSARLSRDATRLSEVQPIFTGASPTRSGRHFGSRLVEARDGTLFVTVGDRGDRPSAQDLSRHNGSVLRITKTGQPAPSNPDLGANAQPEIWSFGHRNPQGAALDLNGNLWVNEHGAQGGDEVNRVQKGRNFGWPLIAYGRHYSGAKIGEGTAKPGLEQPAHYWDPSIAPSGMMFYSGKLWPQWKGQAFVGSLKFDYIARLGHSPMRELEQLSSDETQRVRDIREAPDGTIWFLSVGDGTLYRMSPG